jgi:hypothetical protein
MQRREHRVIASEAAGKSWFSLGGEIDAANTESEPNAVGRDGWELVAAFDTNTTHRGPLARNRADLRASRRSCGEASQGVPANHVFPFGRPRPA